MPPAWRVSANDIAVKGSAHEFVRTPHVHRCRPATVCRCARASVRLVSSLKGSPSGLAKRLCVPPAQGFGAFPCVCHRPKGRLGFSGGVLLSSGQALPVSGVGLPVRRPLSSSSSAVPVRLSSSPCCPGLCPDSPVALPCSLSLSVCLRLHQSPLFLSGWPLSSSPPPPFPVS